MRTYFLLFYRLPREYNSDVPWEMAATATGIAEGTLGDESGGKIESSLDCFGRHPGYLFTGRTIRLFSFRFVTEKPRQTTNSIFLFPFLSIFREGESAYAFPS